MHQRLLVSCFSTYLFVAGTAACFAANNGQGPQLAATCAACHLLDGNDTNLPSIIGRAPEQLTAQLRAFRSDTRASHIMHAVSLSLSEPEVEAVARFLAEQGKDAKVP